MAVIGDTPKVQKAAIVVAMPQSVVTSVEIADIAGAVNDTYVSGKKAGATIVVNTAGAHEIYVAQGGDVDSPWIATDGVTTITPA